MCFLVGNAGKKYATTTRDQSKYGERNFTRQDRSRPIEIGEENSITAPLYFGCGQRDAEDALKRLIDQSD